MNYCAKQLKLSELKLYFLMLNCVWGGSMIFIITNVVFEMIPKRKKPNLGVSRLVWLRDCTEIDR